MKQINLLQKKPRGEDINNWIVNASEPSEIISLSDDDEEDDDYEQPIILDNDCDSDSEEDLVS